MKPIILEANEMTDSTEVYTSRPHPFFVFFIYFILSMVIIVISWMVFSKIDIVVKAQGNVTTEDNLSTVTNTLAGNITNINVVDGQQINEGDNLYCIEYTDLDNQLKQQTDLLSEVQDRIEILKGYLEWLNGKNDALDGLKDNQFYSEICAKAQSVELNYDSLAESSDIKKSQYSTSLNNTKESISYYEDEIAKMEELMTALKDRENLFSQDEVYYYSYVENYIASYNSTNKQYDDKIKELEDSISDLKSNEKSYNNQIKELEKLINSSNDKIQTATAKISELEQTTNTSAQEITTQEITTQEDSLQENKVQETTVQDATVQDNTTQDVTIQDSRVQDNSQQLITQETSITNQKLIEEQKQIISQETSSIDTYNTKIKELEESITDVNNNIDTAESNISNYEQEKENALYTLQMEKISSVEQNKKTSEETLATLNSNKNETQNNLSHVSDDTEKSLT